MSPKAQKMEFKETTSVSSEDLNIMFSLSGAFFILSFGYMSRMYTNTMDAV